MLKFLFEDNEILIEKNHKRLRDDKWNEFVKKIKGHLDDIRARKDEIEKKSYQDKNDPNRLISLTQGDEAKNNGYDDFKKELFDSNHNEEETIKNLRRIAFRDNFRNDIVTNFKYEPKDDVDPKQPEPPQPPLPPEPEPPQKVKVDFIDDGPDSEFDEENPDEIPEPNVIKE